MTDRPDAKELIDAVAAWLSELDLEGAERFQQLVALQGLAIAARELATQAEHAQLDQAAFGNRRSLAKAIARGDHDHDLDALVPTLKEHVRRKLAVARPGYDAELSLNPPISRALADVRGRHTRKPANRRGNPEDARAFTSGWADAGREHHE